MLPYAFQIMNQSFPGYAGSKRLEPFSKDQQAGFGMVRDFANMGANPDYYRYAMDQARQFGSAPASRVGVGSYQSGSYQANPYETGAYNSRNVTPGSYNIQGYTPGAYNARPYTAGKYQSRNVGTERLVDEGGQLGKISDYMNPYTDAVVQPQIRELGKARRRAMIQSGEQATAAGAFGDARQGVADSLTNKNYLDQVSDVTGQGYSDAYNQAMAQRSADVGRFLQAGQANEANRAAAQQFNIGNAAQAAQFNEQARALAAQFNITNREEAAQFMRNLQAQAAQFNIGQSAQAQALNEANRAQAAQFNIGNRNQAAQFNEQARAAAQQFNINNRNQAQQFNIANALQAALANQNFREQALSRGMQAGQSAMQYGLQNNQDYLQRLNAYMNVGNMQQQQGQKLRDYDYQNFQAGVQWPFTQFNMLLSMLTGQPNTGVSTQQTTGGNNGWMNLIGALAGAFL